MEVYIQIIQSIISRQEAIIGPVAIEQAEHVPHLRLNWAHHEVIVDGDPIKVIDHLVDAYSHLFGQISVEVSKEAAGVLLSQLKADRLPHSLA